MVEEQINQSVRVQTEFEEWVEGGCKKAEEWLKTLVEEHWIRNEAVPEGAVECIEERMPE